MRGVFRHKPCSVGSWPSGCRDGNDLRVRTLSSLPPWLMIAIGFVLFSPPQRRVAVWPHGWLRRNEVLISKISPARPARGVFGGDVPFPKRLCGTITWSPYHGSGDRFDLRITQRSTFLVLDCDPVPSLRRQSTATYQLPGHSVTKDDQRLRMETSVRSLCRNIRPVAERVHSGIRAGEHGPVGERMFRRLHR